MNQPGAPMKLLRLLFLFCSLAPLTLFAANTFVEGKDYKVLKTEGKTHTVREFFNPACPACFHAEPAIEAWLKRKPSTVQFTRVPLLFHKEWEMYSRAYYVAVGLNIEETILPLLFDAIQTQQQMLLQPADMATLFVKATNHRYKKAQIEATLTSIMVSGQLSTAQNLMEQYQINELPSFLVCEKYIVSGSTAKSPERMMQIVTYLLALNQSPKKPMTAGLNTPSRPQ
jgi:thiol:disulfide interchange protein DsbA